MKREYGDMWSIFDLTDYFIITTNSYIRQDGAVVMGRGIAKQMKDKYPEVPFQFAKQIKHLGTYGLIFHLGDDTHLGAFQVKHHYADPATVSLIHHSAVQLDHFAEEYPHKRFDMNFPGIGNGRLPIDEVIQSINFMPDNVHVWTFT